MEKSVKDKQVVITGGAQGLGFGIAESFLENKAKVVILLDIDEDTGKEAARGLNKKFGNNKAVFIKCDVTKDLEKVFNDILSVYETVDVLVNNAGTVNEKSIRSTMELNAIAVVEWSLKFYEHMRTDIGGKGGTILNMSSWFGFACDPYLPFYTASKHAVVGFTKCKGHLETFARTGVRMIVLCPGIARTRMNQFEMFSGIGAEFHVQKYIELLKNIPWLTPDVLGKAVVEIFETAHSGSGWAIAAGQPVKELPTFNLSSLSSEESN